MCALIIRQISQEFCNINTCHWTFNSWGKPKVMQPVPGNKDGRRPMPFRYICCISTAWLWLKHDGGHLKLRSGAVSTEAKDGCKGMPCGAVVERKGMHPSQRFFTDIHIHHYLISLRNNIVYDNMSLITNVWHTVTLSGIPMTLCRTINKCTLMKVTKQTRYKLDNISVKS